MNSTDKVMYVVQADHGGTACVVRMAPGTELAYTPHGSYWFAARYSVAPRHVVGGLTWPRAYDMASKGNRVVARRARQCA